MSVSSLPAASVKFSSSIRFVSGDSFDELLCENDLLYDSDNDKMKSDKYVKAPWSVDTRVQQKDKAFTDQAYDCTVGGLQNQRHVSMFHFHPARSLQEVGKLREALVSDVVDLSHSKRELSGLLTGGRVYPDPNRDRHTYSQKLYKELKEILHAAGVKNVSKIWGRSSERYDGPLRLFYNTQNDTWYIHAETEKYGDVLSWRDVRATFSTIDIAPGDTLYTSDDVITG